MVNENKNIKQLIHIFKTLNSIFVFIFIIMMQKQVNATDFFNIENISIDIVYEDIGLARDKANNKAIFIGLDRLLSWKLNNNDYIFIKNILNDINNVPTVELVTTSFRPKLITIGKVIIPASSPTIVSIPTTATASLGM